MNETVKPSANGPQKPARPAANNNEKPTRMRRLGRVLNFRVDAVQESELRERAAQAGLSISDFVRQAALSSKPPPRRRPKPTGKDERAFAFALAALNKIGTNVNQIARVSNAQQHVSFEEFRMLKSLQAELQETRIALLRAFGEEP